MKASSITIRDRRRHHQRPNAGTGRIGIRRPLQLGGDLDIVRRLGKGSGGGEEHGSAADDQHRGFADIAGLLRLS